MANITGTTNNDTLFGTAYNDIIKGLAGADSMAGGKGSDVYYVDNAGDTVAEAVNGGYDTIYSSIDLSLAAGFDNVEKVVLQDGALDVRGNDLNNTLVGNAGENSLRGDGGNDTLIGGAGNDFYIVESLGDKIVEKAGEGHDEVLALGDYSLAAFAQVEDLYLKGGTYGTGNALNNIISGNSLDNVLNGGLGADTMSGGIGNDTYYKDNAGDVITETAGNGTHDLVISTVAFNNVIAEVEDYDFSKFAGGVTFTGSAVANIIKGGKGIDTLTGMAGDDQYYVNNAKDVVIETVGKGTDTVLSSNISLDLAKYANVENATVLGTAALKITGVAEIANTLTGNTGANVLDGKGANDFGGDTLIGGKGSDTYIVRGLNDVVTELDGQGIDTVISTVTHTLADHVEKLTLAAGAGTIDGFGNELKNTIVGNESANAINGGAGADTMKGGKGDDEYIVDDAGDKVMELAGQGHDAVYSSVDFSLASLVAVEDLWLEDLAVKGTGNSLANHIHGSWGNNILDGGRGADTLEGSTGHDKYYVDNLGDVIVEDVNGGELDTVYSTVALSHAFTNVEKYDFTKAVSAVTFTGGDENNMIWSSRFGDTLTGGKGGDVYFLNNTTDKVVELAGEGYDTVYASANITKLWDNVERVMHVNSASTVAWNVTGNDQDNDIYGNAGRNILNGGKGDDFIQGGGGNDVLTGGEGADTFGYSSINFPLSAHDILTDFDGSKDILSFWMNPNADGDGTWGEYEDVVSSVVDFGAGKNVVAHLTNGGSLTFVGCGTGAVDHLADLVADPTTQLLIV